MRYPAAPWYLTGEVHAGAWLAPVASVPPPDVPGWRVLSLGGWAVVGAALARYERPGVLTYNELMASVLVRRGAHVLPTVVRIWVDSEQSRDGGRALWGVPKKLATFRQDAGRIEVTAGGPIATVALTSRTGLPVRVPWAIVQRHGDDALVSPVRTVGRLSPHRVRWTFASDGPLGWLEDATALGGVGLQDFAMAFGGVPQRTPDALAAALWSAARWRSASRRGSIGGYET